MTISVLVADDEAMIRAGIRAILANDPESFAGRKLDFHLVA